MTAWQSIRLLRARPPDPVSGDRLRVFVSALEQSEQLMHAARDVGTAARPLLLFYGLSQAARAIAAAKRDEQWRLSGHGLTWGGDAPELLQRCVKPNPSERSGRQDSFGGLARAAGSDRLTATVALGEVWMAIPHLVEPLPQMPIPSGRMWRRPLRVYQRVPPSMEDNTFTYTLTVLVSGLPDELDAAEIAAELKHYAIGAPVGILKPAPLRPADYTEVINAGQLPVVSTITGHPVLSTPDDPSHPLRARHAGRDLPVLIFPDVSRLRGVSEIDALNQIAPIYQQSGERIVYPRIGVHDNWLTPLMLWWLLLFQLSMVARYDPELWVEALDVNRSLTAIPIEAALDEALEVLPDLILGALTP